MFTTYHPTQLVASFAQTEQQLAPRLASDGVAFPSQKSLESLAQL